MNPHATYLALPEMSSLHLSTRVDHFNQLPHSLVCLAHSSYSRSVDAARDVFGHQGPQNITAGLSVGSSVSYMLTAPATFIQNLTLLE